MTCCWSPQLEIIFSYADLKQTEPLCFGKRADKQYGDRFGHKSQVTSNCDLFGSEVCLIFRVSLCRERLRVPTGRQENTARKQWQSHEHFPSPGSKWQSVMLGLHAHRYVFSVSRVPRWCNDFGARFNRMISVAFWKNKSSELHAVWTVRIQFSSEETEIRRKHHGVLLTTMTLANGI